MKLWAIGDLHLARAANREALEAVPDHGDDWLILAGDVGERVEHLELALRLLSRRFARLIWVPGNHDLWSVPRGDGALRGEAKYHRLVALCREHAALTPEDEYPLWPGLGGPLRIVPLFLLYDYSFRPDHVPVTEAVAWAREAEIVCTDELLLRPDPHPTREAWCAARCEWSERRLAALAPDDETVLVNHWPLRYDLVTLPRIPRFSPWCGTRRSEDWHRRFRARVVVSGHLHVRATTWRDGVRFEEVSLGYPQQWDPVRGVAGYLREILPGGVDNPPSSCYGRNPL